MSPDNAAELEKSPPKEMSPPRDYIHDIPLPVSGLADSDARNLIEDSPYASTMPPFGYMAIFRDLQASKSDGSIYGASYNLEWAGKAKVDRSQNGEPQHIIFDNLGPDNILNIDLNQDTINGKTEAQWRPEAAKMATETFGHNIRNPEGFDSPHTYNETEKQLALSLLDSILKEDTGELASTLKSIDDYGDRAIGVQNALSEALPGHTILLGTDGQGRTDLTMKTENSGTISMSFDGQPQISGSDGKTIYDPQTALDIASDALFSSCDFGIKYSNWVPGNPTVTNTKIQGSDLKGNTEDEFVGAKRIKLDHEVQPQTFYDFSIYHNQPTLSSDSAASERH